MRIALVNQKGGGGKSTLAIHIADALVRRGYRVLLVDTDQQTSALDWAAAREGKPRFPVIGLPTASVHREIPAIAVDYDIVVIDGPARFGDVVGSAIMASDIVLVPIFPSAIDVWASEDVLELIDRGRVLRPELKAAFVVNRVNSVTALAREIEEFLRQEYPLPILATAISQRVAFAECVGQGKTVFETHPNSLAVEEITNLVNDIVEFSNDERHQNRSEAKSATAKVLA